MCKPPGAQARANTFADESTPLPCGPPIIQERSFTFAAEELIGSCRPHAQRREPSWEFTNSPFLGRDTPGVRPFPRPMAPRGPTTSEGRQSSLINLFSRFRGGRLLWRLFLRRTFGRRAAFRPAPPGRERR